MNHELVAFAVPDLPPLALVPAARTRPDATPMQALCLPMALANAAGWHVLNDTSFSAEWDGSDEHDGVRIVSTGTPSCMPNFAGGHLTWQLPYVIRLPPGWSVLLRGPANAPKDGAAPLEGLIEGDGPVTGASIVWKLTRPHQAVTFKAGEPVALLVPMQRGVLESFQPEIRDLRDEPDMAGEYLAWNRERVRLITKHRGETVTPAMLDKAYMLAAAQRRLHLSPFVDRRDGQ